MKTIKPPYWRSVNHQHPLARGLVLDLPFNEGTGNRALDKSGAISGTASTEGLTNIGQVDTVASRKVWHDGTYLYVADSGANLRAFTFDGSVFTAVGHADSTGSGYDVWGDGTYIYLADGVNGLLAYIFDGSSFTEVGHIDDGTITAQGRGVWGDGTYIYLAYRGDGIIAYTFNGTTFTRVGSRDDGDLAYGVWGDGTHVFLANGEGGLFAYTFDGSVFTPAGHIDDGSWAFRVYGDGQYIYLANRTAGLYIYTHDGAAFTNVASIDPGNVQDVFVKDGYIYTANYDTGLGIYLFIEPAITLIGSIDDGGTAFGVHVDNDYIYLANYDDGVRAYHFRRVFKPRTGDIVGADWVPGRDGFALEFNGNSDYVYLADFLGEESELTLAAWIKSAAGARDDRIIAKDASGNRSFYLAVDSDDDDDGTINFILWNTDPSIAAVEGTTDVRGAWHYVVAVYDGAFLRIFVDGKQENMAAQTGNIYDNGRAITIGASGYGNYFDGLIGNAAIYDRALGAREIEWLYRESYCYYK